MSEEEFDLGDVDLDDLEAIDAELKAMEEDGDNDQLNDDLEEEGLQDDSEEEDEYLSEEEEELNSEELRMLEEEVEELERTQMNPEDGNTFISALQGATRPKYAHLMESLAIELNEEAVAAKSCVTGVIPSYLVNPFALPNRLDYEEIFDEIDPEEPNLLIWQLDRFEPIPLTMKQFGKFHSGDCYVLLYITEAFEGGIVINIHHWIGEESTVDKRGSAAFRAVELNMFMGGRCRIYREEEGRESKLFVDYFDDRIEYLVGGTAEGFKHVTVNSPKEVNPCLYKLMEVPDTSGHLCMTLVSLSVDSIDSSFIYLLDSGKRIYQWNGQYSTTKQRHRGYAHAQKIRSNERAGKATVVCFTEGKEDELLKYEEDLFWGYFGGQKKSPPTGPPSEEPVEKQFQFEQEDAIDLEDTILTVNVHGSWDNYKKAVPMVKTEDCYYLSLPLPVGKYQYHYRVATPNGIKNFTDFVRDTEECEKYGTVNVVTAVHDNGPEFSMWKTSTHPKTGKMSLDEIDLDGPPSRSLLTSENSVILDCSSELFVWVGRRCKPLEKQVALAIAKKIYGKYERPDSTPILGVYETAESTTFSSKFFDWDIKHEVSKEVLRKQAKKNRRVQFTTDSLVYVEGLLRDDEDPPLDPMIDPGNGSSEVRLFSLKDGAESVLPPSTKGIFFNSSCYIILYKYQARERPGSNRQTRKFVLYFWAGLNNTSWLAAYSKFRLGFLQMLIDRVGKHRISSGLVLQGKEPKHFLRLMNGFSIVKLGTQQYFSTRMVGPALYQVNIGSHEVGYPRMHVIEVEPKVESLAADYCFVLISKEKVFVWEGSRTFQEEGKISSRFTKILMNSPYHNIVSEDQVFHIRADPSEPSEEAIEFYSILGGNITQLSDCPSSSAKLFYISHREGLVQIERITSYSQMDLVLNSCNMLLLHAPPSVFLWRGANTTESLYLDSKKLSTEWIKQVTPPPTLIEEQQYTESEDFRRFFPGWQSYNQQPILTTEFSKAKEYERSFALEREFYEQQEKLSAAIDFLSKTASSSDYIEEESKILNPADHHLSIDFTPELVKLGLVAPPPTPDIDKYQIFLDGIKNSETSFLWESPEGEEVPLAVAVKGSWADWNSIPMIKYGKRSFGLKLQLDPGRHFYTFLVATSSGAIERLDSTRSVVTRDGRDVNRVRVYLCLNPDFLEQKRKREKEEEERLKEKNRVKTEEELKEMEKKRKEEKRIADEERLKKQLESKRSSRVSSPIKPATEKPKEEPERELTKEEQRAKRREERKRQMEEEAKGESKRSSPSRSSRRSSSSSDKSESPSSRSSRKSSSDKSNSPLTRSSRKSSSSSLSSSDKPDSPSSRSSRKSSSSSDKPDSSSSRSSRKSSSSSVSSSDKPDSSSSRSSRNSSSSSVSSKSETPAATTTAPAGETDRERRRRERRKLLGLD